MINEKKVVLIKKKWVYKLQTRTGAKNNKRLKRWHDILAPCPWKRPWLGSRRGTHSAHDRCMQTCNPLWCCSGIWRCSELCNNNWTTLLLVVQCNVAQTKWKNDEEGGRGAGVNIINLRWSLSQFHNKLSLYPIRTLNCI